VEYAISEHTTPRGEYPHLSIDTNIPVAESPVQERMSFYITDEFASAIVSMKDGHARQMSAENNASGTPIAAAPLLKAAADNAALKGLIPKPQ
jgi:hypothetical protein